MRSDGELFTPLLRILYSLMLSFHLFVYAIALFEEYILFKVVDRPSRFNTAQAPGLQTFALQPIR